MELGVLAQHFAFAVFAFIAIAGALGMTTTMSMFRSAIFLMASFIGVGGLFILLMADLLALLQVMMYIGGMLVMALFMVLFSGDPGGAMMTSMMELPLVEKFFSLGLARGSGEGHEHASNFEGQDAHGHDHGDEHDSENGDHDEDGKGENGSDHDEDGGHDMEPMFIVQQKTTAAVLAAVVWVLLSGLVLLRPAWPIASELPNQHSAEQIGDLLMGKYMIAFEGAGLMILLGIFGAVYLARPGRHPDPTERDAIQAAVDETPAPIEPDALTPEFDAAQSGGHAERSFEPQHEREEDA